MIINGKKSDMEAGITISEMLRKLNLDEDKVVVELNYEIVKKEQYSERIIIHEDEIEIVSFVGGG
ncbi:sulfur carrier protein ThiS [Dethiothermospora halolimnae]|uniref:sulfur carrier protein ThiS n=1 Tax=Dethiothermospora halolimnae TaxID=3114390 RepID=UPI003CCBB8DF